MQAILANETAVNIGDITVKLEIDQAGQADAIAFKADKRLTNIPAKLKKDKKILELNEHKKMLKDQFARSRQSLEEAMTRGDRFELGEIENLFEHPIISKHLEKLVFATETAHGFYREGALIAADKTETKLTASDQIRIAHAVDLHQSKAWSDYQRFCFDNELKQPFKQIFRELYLPTADELKEKSISRRYAGHQVQPRQSGARRLVFARRSRKPDYRNRCFREFKRF